MEQIRKALSPPRTQAPSTTAQNKAKTQRRARPHPEYFGLMDGRSIMNDHQNPSAPRKVTTFVEGQQLSNTLPNALGNAPSIPPSLQPSVNPSPAHSRPASISHSVAHPQAHPAGPPNQPVQWRRASSLSSPFNPYYPTPIASTTLHILMLLVHLGILIVLGILLSDLRRTTATFHTMSNNGTGSYLRVGLYGGGLGSINRPFYVGGLGNSSVATVTASGTSSADVAASGSLSVVVATDVPT